MLNSTYLTGSSSNFNVSISVIGAAPDGVRNVTLICSVNGPKINPSYEWIGVDCIRNTNRNNQLHLCDFTPKVIICKLLEKSQGTPLIFNLFCKSTLLPN
jgi:hypothetical protein